MRNYIKFWWALEVVRLWSNGSIVFATQTYQIGADRESLNVSVENDKAEQLYQNQFQPPGQYYDFAVGDSGVKYFEMNKANVLAILNPSQIVDTELFVDESPRETWSHGH